MEKDLQNMTINDKCSHCGQCCGMFIPFTKLEIKVIKQYVKEFNIKPVTDRETPSGFEGRCCFYDKINKKCNIYPVRPLVCQDFMCNHKDWKKRRDKYEKYGDYNSSLKKSASTLAAFDDLIYEDYYPIIRFIIGLTASNNYIDSDKFLEAIKYFHREDLLKYIKAINENGEEVKGEDLKNEN